MSVSEYYTWFLGKYPHLALPIVGNGNSGLAFIRFPELSPSVRSWATLIFLGASSVGNTGFKLLLFPKMYPILAEKCKRQRVKVLSQKNEKIKSDVDFFLSCLD